MSNKLNTSTDKKSVVDELTEKIHKGVKEVFETGKYREFLKTVSNLHNFSPRNIILAKAQNPNVTMLAGYKQWLEKGRNVQKGERGLKILAPTLKKTNQFRILTDEQGKPKLDKNGKEMTEQIKYVSFFPVTVFDVDQTKGDPIPYLGSLLDDVNKFEELKQTLISVSPVPVVFDDIGINGRYQPSKQQIIIKESLPQEATIRTLAHEIAHATMEHGKTGQEMNENLFEVQAESVAYVVCQHLGIETEHESFSYIYSWSSDKEVPELLSSLSVIQETSNQIISAIDEKLMVIEHHQEKETLSQSQVFNDRTGDIITPEEATGDIITPEEATGDIITPEEATGDIITPEEATGDIITPEEKAGNIKIKAELDHVEASALFDKFNNEPFVVFQHEDLTNDLTMSLSEANNLIRSTENEINSTKDYIFNNDKLDFTLYYKEENNVARYNGLFTFGLGEQDLTTHMKNFHTFQLENAPTPEAQKIASNAVEIFIPYLEQHETMSNIISTATSSITLAAAGKESKQNIPYHEYLIATAQENKELLNSGQPVKAMISSKDFYLNKINNKTPISDQIKSAKAESEKTKSTVDKSALQHKNKDAQMTI